MPKIKGVIFDMDGVLIDAKDWHYEALNRALKLFGYEINRYDHLVTYDGLPTSKKLEMLSVEHGLPRGLHVFINQLKQQYTTEIVYARCKPTFQHEYALAALKARSIQMAVASNSIRASVELMMERAHLTQYFQALLSNQDVAQAKPHPEIYLTAFKRLGLSPDECLIVEDNENGIAAARASGGHVLVVSDVRDVNLPNIERAIHDAESGGAR